MTERQVVIAQLAVKIACSLTSRHDSPKTPEALVEHCTNFAEMFVLAAEKKLPYNPEQIRATMPQLKEKE